MKVHLPDLHLFGFTNQPEAIFAIYVQIYLVHQFAPGQKQLKSDIELNLPSVLI